MVLRVIDLETTGVDPESDAIIEIAAVQLNAERGIASAHEALVNPGQPIPPESSAVHGLIDADVANAPPLRDLISFYDGADAYVAHNAKFEAGFLTPIWGEKVWICTFKCALRLWPDAPGHGNETLRYWLGLINPMDVPRELIRPHRALSDCYVTAAILLKQMELATWGQLRQWSNEPALYTNFTFGKHIGERMDAHADYLVWMLKQADMDEDKKFSAAYWLDRPAAAAA